MSPLRPRTCHGVSVIDARTADNPPRTVMLEMKPDPKGEWQVWGWQQPPLIIPYRADWKDEPRFKEHKHDA